MSSYDDYNPVLSGGPVGTTALFASGLTGTLGVGIVRNGAYVVARSTAVTEYPSGSGFYQATLTAPPASGQFSVVWDDGANFAAEDLWVIATDTTPTELRSLTLSCGPQRPPDFPTLTYRYPN